MEFLTITVMCFLFMYADGSTSCQCRQVPVTQTQKIRPAEPTQLRKQITQQPRSMLSR